MFILFSSPRYFYETPPPPLEFSAVLLTPLSSWEVSWERHPHPFAFQYFPRCATDTSALAFHARTLRLCTFLICRYNSDPLVLCSSGNFAMRAHLRCTSHGFLSFASRKHRGYYACMPGFDVAEGWSIFFFIWIPPRWCPGVLECGAFRISV